jgi:hypothetical protein
MHQREADRVHRGSSVPWATLASLVLVVSFAGPARAGEGIASSSSASSTEGGDFGTLALWEVTGVTGGAESYENQMGLVLSPSVRLGRILRVPKRLAPLRLSLELNLQVELAGNDARFHGAQFSSPALLPGGAEAIALNEVGMVSDVRSGQVGGTERRPYLSDLWLALSHPDLYTIPFLGIDLGGRLAFTFPTSAGSRAAGLRLTLSEGISLNRTLWKRLDLSYSFRAVEYFFSSATAEAASLPETEVEINGRKEPLYQPQRATVLNPSFGFVNQFAATVRIRRKWSLSASYSLTNTFTHPLSPVSLEGLPAADVCGDGLVVAQAAGGTVIRCGDRAERDSHWFQMYLEYQVLRALSLSLGLSTLQPVRHEGAGVSNPFIQTLPTANYTTVELGLLVDFEQSASVLRRIVRR